MGEKSKDVGRGAIEAGLREEQVVYIDTPKEAGHFMDQEVQKGDIVLVKGSQSARMEKVSKDLLADPSYAFELLVRQTPDWLKK